MVLEFVSRFWKRSKMHFKKTNIDVFRPFYGLTLTYNCSVISQGSMLIFPLNNLYCSYISCGTIFLPPKGPSAQKTLFKKVLFAIFCPFQASLQMQLSESSAYFVRWWGLKEPPNEGPEGPPMPSTGARRKGLQGP